MSADLEARPAAAGLLRGLYDRFAHLIHELGKFGVVGGICYCVDFAIFNVLLAATGEPYSAKTVATIVGASLAFIGNRYWTWRDRDRRSLRREYLLYFSFNLVGLLIGLACIGVSYNLLGSIWPEVFRSALATNIAANVIGVGLASLFRFWAYRRFVFKPVTSVA